MNTKDNLKQNYQTLCPITLKEHFSDDTRAQQFTLQHRELLFDYSKNHINTQTMHLLSQFAEEVQLKKHIDALFNGECVNATEQRPALHTLLRDPQSPLPMSTEVKQVLARMEHLVEKVHAQQWLGCTNQAVTDILSIGIGGSDLGPRMVTEALTAYSVVDVNVHYVANVDGAELYTKLSVLNPETTLILVVSKSFSTIETLSNANSVRQWFVQHCQGLSLNADEHIAKHFIAISANVSAAKAFGIAEANIFPIWDWVGGRYSLWSAIGLPIALALGMKHFYALLQGAHGMDQHYLQQPFLQNMPVIAALLEYWYAQYWGTTSRAVIPYAQYLHRLPAYLQQLDMESLGKRVDRGGNVLTDMSGVVIWGTEGTNGQHSYHQLLHQGQQVIPVDFILVKEAMSPYHHQHQQLLASCIAQSQALLQGKSLTQATEELRQQGLDEREVAFLAPHKEIIGNKPSNSILLQRLTPENLGALIAFYEHKVYTLSVLLDINAFDQWGVELGKQLGKPVLDALSTGQIDDQWDVSTQQLLKVLLTETD